MQTNEATIDRAVRLVIAVIAGLVALSVGGAAAVVLWIVAGVMVVTAASGFCPLYKLVGVSTCRRPAHGA
jgi:hypothetical protein